MIKKTILMLLVLVGGVVSANAYDLYLRCNLNATQDNNWLSWDNDLSDYKFTFEGNNGTENVFTYTIDAANWVGDINFRLHNSDWGNTQQIPKYGNTVEWSFNNILQETYEIWANGAEYKSDNYPNKYFTIKHGNVGASKYKITVYWRTSDNRLWMAIDLVSMPVKIAEGNDYATFSCDRSLNFPTGDDATVKAYTASISDDSKVKMTRITGAVPANTGLFIAGASADVPAVSSANAITGNLLHAGTGAAVGSDNCYVLVKRDGVYGFAKVASTHVTAKGKAYLQTDETLNAPSLGFYMDDDETTTIHSLGIENANTQDGVMYNLAGQRIDQPTKGIYIVNGRKVIVK